MNRRITISLSEAELGRLQSVARAEYRTTRDQARYLLLSALGLVDSKHECPMNSKSASVEVARTQTSAFAEINL